MEYKDISSLLSLPFSFWSVAFYFELHLYYMYLIDILTGGRQNSKLTPMTCDL